MNDLETSSIVFICDNKTIYQNVIFVTTIQILFKLYKNLF